MDKSEIFTRIARVIRREKWVRIKTLVTVHGAGQVIYVEDELFLFPLVQDNQKVYGFNRDGGSGTSVNKDDIIEIEELP